MELTKLAATSRVLGKSRDNARLRKAGQIPAVYYGKGQESVNISVSAIRSSPRVSVTRFSTWKLMARPATLP